MKSFALFILLSTAVLAQSADSVVTTLRILSTDGIDTVLVRFPVTVAAKGTYQAAYGKDWRERVSEYILTRAILPTAEDLAESVIEAVIAGDPTITAKLRKARRTFYYGQRPTTDEAAP
jgi:hypothetical protein